MGVLANVPFLGGYNEQDQINRAQESQGFQRLGQMMQMQHQDRTMRLQDLEYQKKEQQAKALETWAASQSDPQIQAMVRAAGPAALPYIMEKMKPQGAMSVPDVGLVVPDKNEPNGWKTAIPVNPKVEKLPWYVSRGQSGETVIDPAFKEFEAMKASKGGTKVTMPAAVTPVTIQDPNNPNSTIIIDGRTRQVLGNGPKLTETGKANFKQATTMQGLGGDLQRAEDLLLGQTRDSQGNPVKGNLPTGSGIGSLYDSAAGMVGISPSGAAEADALKVVAGRLVQKVPRFEGPQSDKDVALYKQMAADAGNEKLPRDRRLLAVQTMRQLYQGYEDGTKGSLVQQQISGSPASVGVPKNRIDVRSQADRILGL